MTPRDMSLASRTQYYLRRLWAPATSPQQTVPAPVATTPTAPEPAIPAPVTPEPAIAEPIILAPRQRRAVVISNCQCVPLAAWLTVSSADTVFDFWGVHVLSVDQRQAEIEAFVARARAAYDFIVAIPLSADYHDLSTDRIAETFNGLPVIRISNIYFSGHHPDLTYIGGLNRRVTGPVGDYHSKLAIYGFLEGLTVAQTQALFHAETYRRLGYFDEVETSLATLRERDASVDLSVVPVLERALRTGLCFYSVNHPTSLVFSAYTAQITDHLAAAGLSQSAGLPVDPSLCPETLAGSVIYPVYPEIAAHIGMPHVGSYAFKPDGAWTNPIDLEMFLAREFAAFDALGRETLALSHAAQLIKAHFPALAPALAL